MWWMFVGGFVAGLCVMTGVVTVFVVFFFFEGMKTK